ncbi:MAG TPA: class I SAM-dependent methyltransferase [Thermoanaerobaculia bacterium]|nr:class I SAM-dependent methyltransferase [Thermoanaerobaculia bacterium]
MTGDAERRIASQFDSRFLRSYVRSKLRNDPVYRAVLERLRGTSAPIFDIGCGVGLLEFFLRENGVENAVTGIDHDERKIETAKRIASKYTGLQFRAGDARDSVPAGATVVMLDVLHYFTGEDQRRILENAAAAQGDLILIRDAVRDGTLRYRLTAVQEMFSRAVRWLRAERLNFPAADDIVRPFREYTAEVTPMWGRTPFNNYLFVLRRSVGGITNR